MGKRDRIKPGLPWITISWPGCCFSLATSRATSPRIRCELFHSSFFSVDETTYFGMLLNRSAKPSGSFLPGQAAANPSYVTRPRRSASVANVSPFEFLDLVVPEWEGPLLRRLNDPVQRDEERGCKTATRMGRHDRITSLADQNREDNISLQRETGRREASAWRDAMHAGGVPALTPAACPTVFQTRIETLIYPASSRWSQQWFDGQSGGDTPGPIPNPEVKPAHVPCGSAVREPARSLPSFEEGLGRRPRYASRPSLWWTTKRAALTAVGPWNAVSHSLFLFVASRAEFQSDDDQRDCEHEDHVAELRNRDRRGGAAADQRVPARGRVVQERPVYELRAGEARVHPRRHRETVGPRGHTREVPVERATVRPGRCGARSDVVEPVWKRVLDRHRPGRDGACVVVV